MKLVKGSKESVQAIGSITGILICRVCVDLTIIIIIIIFFHLYCVKTSYIIDRRFSPVLFLNLPLKYYYIHCCGTTYIYLRLILPQILFFSTTCVLSVTLLLILLLLRVIILLCRRIRNKFLPTYIPLLRPNYYYYYNYNYNGTSVESSIWVLWFLASLVSSTPSALA